MDFDFVKSQNPTKPPILFLHGWGGDKRSFLFLKNYFFDRDLWFVSFAGHGKSSVPKKPMKVADFAKEIVNFVAEHKIKKPDLVAHSFGGRVALVLCAKNQNAFGRVVLTGCAGLRPKRGFCYYFRVLKFKIKKWLVKLHLIDKKRLNGCGSADYNALCGVMRETFKKVVNEDLKRYAKKVKNETLLIWGEKDDATPLEMGEKLNKFIKNSALVVFYGCSHFCFLEQPVRFALILNYFLV